MNSFFILVCLIWVVGYKFTTGGFRDLGYVVGSEMDKLKKDDIVIKADRDNEDIAKDDLANGDLANEDISSLLLSYLGAMVGDDNEAIEDFSHVILLLDRIKSKGHFSDFDSCALSQGLDSLHNLCGARRILREKLRSVLDELSAIFIKR